MNERVEALALCEQCGGPAYICEQPDSTCRLKERALEWLNAGHMVGSYVDERTSAGLDADARKLAPLLRQVEDESWARLSEARTKQNEELAARVAELETAARAYFIVRDAAFDGGAIAEARAVLVETVERKKTSGVVDANDEDRADHG